MASFLHLPSHLRLRIYRFSGLPQDCEIDLLRRNYRKSPPLNGGESYQTCFNLFLTCKTFYIEASVLFYSSNRIKLVCRNMQDLQKLDNLSPSSIAALRHLKISIYLNPSTYTDITEFFRLKALRNETVADTDYGMSSDSKLKSPLLEWENAGKYVATNITPNHFHLQFSCDVSTLEEAMPMVDPIRKMPSIARCSISLNWKPTHDMQSLAQEVALQAMGYHPDLTKSKFRFLDLPTEIRERILLYTDLVTPNKEVEWKPEKGYHICFWKSRHYPPDPSGMKRCTPMIHHLCKFRACFDESPYPNVVTYGLFCRRIESAYSLTCHCWSIPTYLFLVCRKMRQDAQMVFFSQNRFVVMPAGEIDVPVKETSNRLEASMFLQDVMPQEALFYLRRLDLIFPPFEDDYLVLASPAYTNWIDTIAYMAQHCDLPALTLTTIRNDHADMGYWKYDDDPRNRMTKPRSQQIIQTIWRMFLPLQKLADAGLGGYVADIVSPFAYTTWGRESEEVQSKSFWLQWQVEKRIMGMEYDSTRYRGEGREEDKCQWLL